MNVRRQFDLLRPPPRQFASATRGGEDGTHRLRYVEARVLDQRYLLDQLVRRRETGVFG
jgi:hypothetical protein